VIQQRLSNFFNNSLKLDKRSNGGDGRMDTGFVHQVRIKRNDGKTIGSNQTKSGFIRRSVRSDMETIRDPPYSQSWIRDLSISIQRETMLPKRLHSRAVTCELNDHRIKFASTATATERERGGSGMIMATRYSDFKSGNLCVRKDNWIWKSRHPRLNASTLFQ